MSATNSATDNWGPLGDLEEQQYHALYFAYDVPLQDIRKKSFKWFFRIGTLLLLISLMLASSVPIPNYLQIPIVMENTSKDHVRLFTHAVHVSDRRVSAGEEVQPGQPICKVSSPQIQTLISAIRRAQNDLQVLQEHDSLEVHQQVKNMDKELDARQSRITALLAEQTAAEALFQTQKASLSAEMAYAHTLAQKDSLLFKEEVISEVDHLASQRNHLAMASEMALAEKAYLQRTQQFNHRLAELKESLVTISNQQAERLNRYQAEEQRLRDQLRFARQDLRLHFGAYEIDQDALVLLAPSAGLITYCYLDNQLLQAGEMLYRLAVNKGHYEARGMIEANQIGYVRPEMQAKVMLETFPHFEWGSLTGAVGRISTSPNERGTYPITIAITQDNPKITPFLQNGQTGTCSLVFERKSLFGYMFRDIKRLAAEAVY